MESANFHHHHQQQEDQQRLVDSSAYGLAWRSCSNDTNSRDLKQHMNNIYLTPCLNTSTPPMAQDLGFPWSTISNNGTNISAENNLMTHQLQRLARIKEELLVSGSHLELSEIISSSPTSSIEDLHLQVSPTYMSNNDHQQIRYVDNNNQDMLLTTFSNGCRIKDGQLINQIPSSGESISYSNNSNSCSKGAFSQIFQSSTSSTATSSSSFDINLSTLDLFVPSRFYGSFSHQPSSLDVHNLGGLYKDDCLSYGLDQMHQPNQRQDVCPSKVSPAFITEGTESKRPASNCMDAKAPQATVPKKSKLESRPSCAPLKVRKERLGDRISALQQMVAPFGKTDTASVLMEAIGYIKFLQHQVKTLSVPYMNSTYKTSRTSTRGGSKKDGNEVARRDLKSRGLCLVPLSCLSCISYGGGSVWPTP